MISTMMGHARRWGMLILLALLLTTCGASEDNGQPTAIDDQPTARVATIESPEEPSTAIPTTAVPTAVPSATPTVTPPAPLAAVVNGQYVFLADYERQVIQYEQALEEMGIDLNTDEGQAHLAQARKDVLEGLIDEILIEQGGAALGVVVSDEQLEAQVEADIVTGGGKAAFEEWLASTGQTREDYERMLRRSLTSQLVWEIVASDVPGAMEQVHARTIVVGSEEDAQQLVATLREGADFVALAREQSLDLATKDNGGDLGWFPRGIVAIELENAAFALQPGGISEPVAVGEGFHVIQVVERETARPLTDEMLQLLKRDRFDRWLEELRSQAVIERMVGE